MVIASIDNKEKTQALKVRQDKETLKHEWDIHQGDCLKRGFHNVTKVHSVTTGDY